MIEANLPFSMDRTKERVVTPTDKIANILSLEHFKQMSLDENFFKLDIDMDTSLISENEDFYIVNVPGRLEEKNDLIDCLRG